MGLHVQREVLDLTGLEVHRYPRGKQTLDDVGELMLQNSSQFGQDVWWSRGCVEATSGAAAGDRKV